MAPLESILAGISSAISIKLASSIDDVVWLAPFFTGNQSRSAKLRHASIYICVCLLQTMLAMVIATSGDSIVDWLTKGMPGVWSSDRILTVGAGVLMALYALKLGCEAEAKDDDESDTTGMEGSWALFTIAFLGSLDDLTLFVPMLLGNGFDAIQLVIGGLISASFIVLLCVFIGLCKPLSDLLSGIPLVFIVGGFAAVLLTKGAFFDGDRRPWEGLSRNDAKRLLTIAVLMCVGIAVLVFGLTHEKTHKYKVGGLFCISIGIYFGIGGLEDGLPQDLLMILSFLLSVAIGVLAVKSRRAAVAGASEPMVGQCAEAHEHASGTAGATSV